MVERLTPAHRSASSSCDIPSPFRHRANSFASIGTRWGVRSGVSSPDLRLLSPILLMRIHNKRVANGHPSSSLLRDLPHEHPVVPPHVSHFKQVPFRTIVKLWHSGQASPS